MEETKDKFPVLEGELEKLESGFKGSQLEILQKLESLEQRGDEIEKLAELYNRRNAKVQPVA